MSVIIFFSAIDFFCRNDVQAIDFLRKGSYAPGHYGVSVMINIEHLSVIVKCRTAIKPPLV